MGKPEEGLRGRGPLGVGITKSRDGRSPIQGISAPKTTRYLRVWFGNARGRPAVFEYEPEVDWLFGTQIHKPYNRLKKLSFKPKSIRDWYEVGDLVLYSEMEERWLIKLYPELAPTAGSQDSVLSDLVMGFLVGPPDNYMVAQEITRIEPAGNGKGRIELAPVLILDDKNFVKLEKRRVCSQLELSSWWTNSKTAQASLSVMRPVAMIFYEVAMAMGTGGVGNMTRGAARGAMLMTLRGARRHVATRVLARKVVVNLAKDTGKATVAGTRAFIGVFAKAYRVEAKKQSLASRTSSGESIDRKSFEVALTKAAGGFSASFVTTLLDIPMEKALKDAGYGPLEEAISKRIIQAFGTGIPGTFAKAISAAWAAELQNPGSFDDVLGKEMFSELQAKFTSVVKVDFKSIGESLMS